MSASWGDDDFWDVAARYAGEWNGIKVSAAAAYNQWSDGNNCGPSLAVGTFAGAPACITGSNFLSGTYPNPGSSNYFQAGLYVEHVPTGLWGMVDYGHLSESGTQFFRADGSFVGQDILPDTTTWYFKAGLRERWTQLGHTVLYGEYLRNDDGNNFNLAGGTFQRCTDRCLQQHAARMGSWRGAGDRRCRDVPLAQLPSPVA